MNAKKRTIYLKELPLEYEMAIVRAEEDNVAEKLGISERHLSNIKKGNRVGLSLAKDFAELLDLNLEEITAFSPDNRIIQAALMDFVSEKLETATTLIPNHFKAEKVRREDVIRRLRGISSSSHIDYVEEDNLSEDNQLLFKSIFKLLETPKVHLDPRRVVKPRSLSESLDLKKERAVLNKHLDDMYERGFRLFHCVLPKTLYEDKSDNLSNWEIEEQNCVFIAKQDVNFVYVSAFTMWPADFKHESIDYVFELVTYDYLEGTLNPTEYWISYIKPPF